MRYRLLTAIVLGMLGLGLTMLPLQAANGWTLIGWNDLGMHCMDSDYSVFTVLPPYNTIHAQLVDPSGHLVRSPSGITVTYQAVADPSGSINTTSIGKTNFWDYVQPLFGANPQPNVGLAGFAMPGSGNVPQLMEFDSTYNYFSAVGIPLTPIDDSGNINNYPMMRLVAKDSTGAVLATADIVLPISEEMYCNVCHKSNGMAAAEPSQGWVFDSNPERDYRLNILRLHDDKQGGTPAFTAALATAGFNSAGLYATVVNDNHPILCDACHASNALPGTGIQGIPQFTRSIHSYHAPIVEPAGTSPSRNTCYQCHPGQETQCLRGAMGSAVGPDGSLEIQCQSCHGDMSAVGAAGRQGWLDEPSCQNCHTGTALNNNGQIRYTSAFETSGARRVAVNSTFATNPNTPAAGFSLYRFSEGHGTQQCEDCHGATHAIYPTSERNDNILATEVQGHVGTISDCTSCHTVVPSTINGGPHGMHPIGQGWIQRHPDAAEGSGASQCRTCHGVDYTGTVLSRALGDRVLSTNFGTKQFWRGYQIGCYTCHNGPNSEHATANSAPHASDASATVVENTPVSVSLSASDPDGQSVTLRIVSQPSHGTVGLVGKEATYYPHTGYVGGDSFTFAASDGQLDSNLATVSLTVQGGPSNQPPVAQVGPDQLVTVNQTVVLQGSGSDPDGDTVTYSWSQVSGPQVSLTNANQATASFVAPSVTENTTLVFRLTVRDGKGGIATKDTTVTVSAAPLAQNTFYFPQIGNGENTTTKLQTSMIFVNTGAASSLTVQFYDTDGNPMNVGLVGSQQVQSVYQTTIQKGQAVVLQTDGNGTLWTGYARVNADAAVGATAVFTQIDPMTGIILSEAGVPASTSLTSFTIFVDSLGTYNTGLAIINPPEGGQATGAAANLTFRLYDNNFNLISTKTASLPDGQHMAQFVNEIFSSVSAQAGEMTGTVAVESDQPVVALTIRTTLDMAHPFPQSVPTLAVFPVIPGIAAP